VAESLIYRVIKVSLNEKIESRKLESLVIGITSKNTWMAMRSNSFDKTLFENLPTSREKMACYKVGSPRKDAL